MEDRTQKLKPVFIGCVKGDQLKNYSSQTARVHLFWMYYILRACL